MTHYFPPIFILVIGSIIAGAARCVDRRTWSIPWPGGKTDSNQRKTGFGGSILVTFSVNSGLLAILIHSTLIEVAPLSVKDGLLLFGIMAGPTWISSLIWSKFKKVWRQNKTAFERGSQIFLEVRRNADIETMNPKEKQGQQLNAEAQLKHNNKVETLADRYNVDKDPEMREKLHLLNNERTPPQKESSLGPLFEARHK